MDAGRFGFLRGRSASTPLRPPWAKDEMAFVALCSRCHDCIGVCPTRVIVVERGYPRVDFSRGECTFCGECVKACATGALDKAVLAERGEPWRVRATIEPACLALNQTICRTCGEMCEAGAIAFPARPGAVAQPVVDAAVCTGCGACVAPCPVAAITIRQACG